jgi:transposase
MPKAIDARSLSDDKLEEKRMTAVKLHKKGESIKAISLILDVHRITVGRWIINFKTHGKKALIAKVRGRRLGEDRILSEDQEINLKKILEKECPESCNIDSALWTIPAIQKLIKSEYNITMPRRTISSYLKRWGFSPQKPKKQAYEQNPKEIKKWINKDYKKILAMKKKENAEINWCDEAGLSTTDHGGRGFSPIGKTPIRKHAFGKRARINAISSITNKGKLRFMLYEKKFTSGVFIKFLNRLIKRSKKKIFLILDNYRVHKSKAVKDWLLENKSNIKIFFLPKYSPNLNPAEYLNCDFKNGVLQKPTARNKLGLKTAAHRQLTIIQRQPYRVKSYFRNKNISYAM